jgi:vitamin B12 transporter
MPRFSGIRFSGILLCILSLTVWAQERKIAGTVLDPDHAAIPRATIRLLKSNGVEVERTVTDSLGHFEFRRKCPEDCSIEVRITGFQTKTQPADQQVIVLGIAPVQQTIAVTATRTATPTEQIGASVTVITGEQIEQQQQLLASDVLREVPGLTVIRSGGLGAITSVFSRGGESDYNKVLLDGIPLNEPGGAFDFGSLAANDLDRIEIVRGPQSALFGSDAMASVIQFFSRPGEREDARPHVALNFDAGKFRTLHGGADLNGAIHGFDYDLSYNRLNTDNEIPNSDFRDSTGAANFGLNLGQHTQLRWISRGDSSFAGTPGQVAFGQPIPSSLNSFFRKADGYTGFSVSNQTTSRWDQRLAYGFARTRQRSTEFGLDPPFTPQFGASRAPFEIFDFLSDFVNDTRRHHLDYQSNLRVGLADQSWGQHIFTFAFEWDRENGFLNDFALTQAPTRAQRDNFGGTFQYQMAVGRFFLTNGVRIEQNGGFGRAVIPRSSAAYLLRRTSGRLGATKLKFNFGLGIKEPNFTESFSLDPNFLGNPRLRPERTRSFDFGMEQRLWNDRAKIEANWFDNRFRDLIEFQITSFSPFSGTFFNLDRTKAQGAELVFETAPLSGLRFTAGYTYLNAKITKSNTPSDPVFGDKKQLFRRPRHSGSLGVAWDWRRLTLTTSAVYVGRRADSDFLGLVPPLTSDAPYTNWQLALTYRIAKHLSYTAEAANLLNQHYMEALGFPALRISYRTGARFNF